MIPTLPFGRTGHDSIRTIFGAAAFWDPLHKDVVDTNGSDLAERRQPR